MILTSANFDALAESLREPVAFYVDRLAALCGPRLLGVTFYGPSYGQPAVAGAALPNAVVFDAVDLEMLARIAREGQRFGAAGISAPWALTPGLIRSSRDTFPLELLEIEAQHVTVYGTDHFAALGLEAAHLRLECERELKVIEVHLQRGLLAAAGDEQALGRLAAHLTHTFLRVLRGLAWLVGRREAQTPYDLVAAVESAVGGRLDGVRRALDDSETTDWQKFSQLYADVRALAEFADHLP